MNTREITILKLINSKVDDSYSWGIISVYGEGNSQELFGIDNKTIEEGEYLYVILDIDYMKEGLYTEWLEPEYLLTSTESILLAYKLQ